jgi:glycosyltransferase involved in cell wall biosynthesis
MVNDYSYGYFPKKGRGEKDLEGIISRNKDIKVSVYVSTKNRYYTTLIPCLISIMNQTKKVDELLIFDDSDDQLDLRNDHTYSCIFRTLDQKGISWKFIFGEKKGQVLNHQKALYECKNEWLWRLDDDEIAEQDALEKMSSIIQDNTGAVGCLILDPQTNIQSLPPNISDNKIKDILCGQNIQWYKFHDIKEVEHLYSSFIFRKEAMKGCYCDKLSEVGHREESIATHNLYRKGFKLLINPNTIIWHWRNPQGGIRSYQDEKYWRHDEEIFHQKLKEWETSSY